MKLRFEIKTVSEMNQREHWGAKLNRKKKQQRDFSILFKSKRPNIPIPCDIKLIRYSCKKMDTDNLASSFKHVIDQFCREIGIDDGDGRLSFSFDQVRIPKREHYFEMVITERKAKRAG